MSLALRELESTWAGLLALGDDPVEVKAALMAFMPELIATYGNAAAVRAGEFFEDVMPVGPAMLAPPVNEEQVAASVAYAARTLFDQIEYDYDEAGKVIGARTIHHPPEATLRGITRVTERLVKQPGRSTIHFTVGHYGLTYARVPSGTETCAWCLMLASRGAVYTSKNAAKYDHKTGQKYHDDCDCAPVPANGPIDYPEGYEPDQLYDTYYRPVFESGMKDDEVAMRMRETFGMR